MLHRTCSITAAVFLFAAAAAQAQLRQSLEPYHYGAPRTAELTGAGWNETDVFNNSGDALDVDDDAHCGSSACSSGDGCCQSGRLLGWIAPSDVCFNNFISPITNPVFFEDPRTLSELRFMFLNQVVPETTPLLQGGDFQLWAMQFRVAVSERLSIIATKDGYINLHTDGLTPRDADGWADVAAGVKYNVLRDPCRQWIGSVGMTYEIDLGNHDVFQGRGDGEFHFFLSGGAQLGERGHWLSGTGFRLPTDHTARSQMFYWSNHWDYEVLSGLYSLLELNWYHWLRSGEAFPASFEGGDLLNLGSVDVAGNDIVTLGIGGRWKPRERVEIGIAWEVPLTDRRDILHDRVTADLILRY